MLDRKIVSFSETEKPKTIDVAVITKPRSEPNIDAMVPYTVARLSFKMSLTQAAPSKQ